MIGNHEPPVLAQGLLHRLLPTGPVRESILGDLHERYQGLAGSGVTRARIWYWKQAVSIGSGYLIRRLRGSTDHESVGAADRNVGEPVRSPTGDLLREVGLAWRQLRKSPGFAFVAVGTLAVGIGANTAAVSAALHTFRPALPFGEPDRLVRVFLVPESRPLTLSPRIPVFQLVADGVTGFESLAASRFTNLTLRTSEAPERVIGNAVTPGWLETLGVEPVLGRSFTPDEEAAGEESGVVLVSYAAWQTRFGAGDVLGRTLSLNGLPRTVIGVLPPGFDYPYNAEFWIPFRAQPGVNQGFWALNMKGRLAPGVTMAQLSEELAAISVQARGRVEGFGEDMTLTAIPIREILIDGEGSTVAWLVASVGFLLLIVCTNLANLMLARAVKRETEFAVRSSLGASFGRLVRQSLVESLVLTSLGGVAGCVLAWFGVGLLGTLIPDALQTVGSELTLSGPTLAVSLALTAGTGLFIGVLPAIRLAGTPPADALRRGARSITGGGRGRLTSAIVTGELAAALILLTGVGLMVRGFRSAQAVDLGYDDNAMVVFSVELGGEFADAPNRIVFQDQFIERMAALPGVTAAGATTMFPRKGGNILAQLVAEGQSEDESQLVTANDRMVSDGYLQGMGARLLSGRYLSVQDASTSEPVAVLGERLANRLWPDASPIGRRLRNARSGPDAPWVTVVGVVEDIREADDVPYSWYHPYDQGAEARSASVLTFFARGGSGVAPGVRDVRGALDRVAPSLPIFELLTASQINSDALVRERSGAQFSTAFSVLGLVLAAMGVYGAISGLVARKRRDYAIRLALGGDWTSILADLGKHIGRIVLAGAIAGWVGAFVLVRLLESRVVGVGGWDVAVFTGALVVLVVTAFVSAAVPALGAARLPPHTVLSDG